MQPSDRIHTPAVHRSPCSRSAVTLWLALAVCWASCCAAAPLNIDVPRIDGAIKDYMQHTHTPAVSVYVDQGGAPLLVRAWGVADAEHNVRASPDFAFEMGSISKSITAHAVLQLVVRGKLALNGKVGDYLPTCTGPAAGATIEQLLTHTAGLPDYMYQIPSLQGRFAPGTLTVPELAAAICGAPLRFASGTFFSYSNSNYYLLGLIIEQVTGRSYYDVVEHDVVEPLHIGKFWSPQEALTLPRLAVGYVFHNGKLERTRWMDGVAAFSAGCWVTTASTLGRYRRAVYKSSLVDSRVRALLTTATQVSSGVTNDYMLGGMRRFEFDGLRAYTHAGGSWGQFAYNAYYPERDLTIIVMTNENPGGVGAAYAERAIARIVLGIRFPSAAGGTPVHSPTRFVGRYVRTDTSAPARSGEDPPQDELVTLQGQQLAIASAETDGPLPLVVLHGETFGPSPFGLAPEPEELFVYRFSGRDRSGHALSLYVGETATSYTYSGAK